jgi:HPt (histidine-containing phosphotransfer) domain-containing protein
MAIVEQRTASTLESDVGTEVYQELLAAFMDSLTLTIVELSRAAALGDVPAARYIGHQIVGTAAGFGAVELGELAQRLLWTGSDQKAQLGSIVDKIDREISRLQVTYDASVTHVPVPHVSVTHVAVDDAPPVEGQESLVDQFGAEVYQQMLTAFLHQISRQLVELENAAEVGDFPRARYAAHQIRGTAPSFGAVRLDQLAHLLLLTGDGEAELLGRIVAEMVKEIGTLQVVLAEVSQEG